MSYISQNFRLFLVSNLSVQNFRIFLLMYLGSVPLKGASREQRHIRVTVSGGRTKPESAQISPERAINNNYDRLAAREAAAGGPRASDLSRVREHVTAPPATLQNRSAVFRSLTLTLQTSWTWSYTHINVWIASLFELMSEQQIKSSLLTCTAAFLVTANDGDV